MRKNLNNRVIAITGAFGNLGIALAVSAVEQGARVILIDRGEKVLMPPILIGALVLEGVDLTSLESAQQARTRIEDCFGKLDGLVNAAGGFRWQTLAESEPADWDFLYSVNLKTAVIACKAFLPLLQRSGRGSIVNIGAAAALNAGAGMGPYAASKSGVARLTESLAQEMKDTRVRVNAVLPSIIDTPQNRIDMPDADFTRWVTPDALSAVILFLLSDDAEALTGALIPVLGRI